METFNLVIIGAGMHGLAMAKAYTEVCPLAKVLIVDSASSVGGVWAKERVYPGLKTNNLLGSYEFSDFPMLPDRFGGKVGQHIPGASVHEYFTQFADHFNLSSRIRLRHTVRSAQLQEDGRWLLRVSTVADGKAREMQIVGEKLVVATGLTSEPFVPDFPGKDGFHRHLFHAKELKARGNDLKDVKEVVVLGGNKSAWDVCYSAATNGAHVHMVMRPSGGGPSWVWPVLFSPLKLSIQRLATTRFFAWFDPCIWSRADEYSWIRYLLHKTWLGQLLVSALWYLLGRIVHQIHGYDSHPEMQKLKPWVSPFWMGNSLSIHNYDSNWFDLVRQGRIHVHIADITSLSDSTVHLSNGVSLQTDALICCTGWKVVPTINFLPKELAANVRLPTYGVQSDDDTLVQKARHQILKEVPSLRRGPKRSLPSSTSLGSAALVHSQKPGSQPYRLYRFMIPSEKSLLAHRNIALIGTHLSVTATMVAEAQALWVTAYFENKIPHLHPERIDHSAVEYEAILHNEYTRMRHPPEAGGSGERCPDLVLDSLSYIDLLLCDLGLNPFRKGVVWKEVFYRYWPNDFCGMVKEWLEKREGGLYNVDSEVTI